MVVEGLVNNSSYFSYDFPEIKVREIRQFLNVTIRLEGQIIYNEKMAGQDVSIADFGELLSAFVHKPYLSLSKTSVIKATNVNIALLDTLGGEAYNVKVYFSRMSVFTSPGDLKLFVSRYNKIDTACGRYEFVSFFKRAATHLKVGVAYRTDTVPKYLKKDVVLPADNDVLIAERLGVTDVARLVSVDPIDILFYDVCLLDEDNVTDKLRFNVDGRAYREVLNLIYHNAFGLPETFACTGYIKHTPELESEQLRMLRTSRRINSKIKQLESANTGFLSAAKRKAFEDLLTSDEVCSYEGEKLEGIVIDDADFDYTKHSSEASSATLSFYPVRTDEVMKRKANLPRRIFDKTFDLTFD